MANQKRAIRQQQSLVARLEHHPVADFGDGSSLTDRDVLIATAFGKLRKTDQELLPCPLGGL